MKKILLLFLFSMLCFKVHAAEYLDLIPIDGVFSSQLNVDTGAYFSSNQKKYFMDGKIVYCVEPGVDIYTREYSPFDISLSSFDRSIIDKIKLIGYFGYDYPGHQSDSYFLAAQELIWELIGHNEVHFTSQKNDMGDMINVDIEKNNIMSLVNHYYVKPSFSDNLITGVYHNEIVLVDSNNVLSNYEVVSTNNNVAIDGNKLIIKFSNLGSDEIVLKKKKYDNLSSVSYMDQYSQDFMFLRADDVFSSIYIESFIPLSNIHISKSGLLLSDFDNGKFIYDESNLSDVVFGLYASDDVFVGDELVYYSDQFIQELVTTQDGVSSVDLPNGDYYLKEISTNDEFIINNEKVLVHLENYNKEVETHMIDLKNERKKVFINLRKYGEFFDGIDNEKGVYSLEPLGKVKFGLYSSNDIYSSSGDLLVSKDVLIQEFLTNDDGYVFESVNLPFGTYYMKELETSFGYKLDENIYEFSISGDSDIIQVNITKEPIVNEMIKSTLVINKVDEYGNGLGGAKFKIFDSFDNLIYEGVTDSNGFLCIDDLAYGKYYFYEVSAPNGYYVDDTVYNVNAFDDNSLIQVKVVNNKMPVTSDIYDIPRKFSMVGLGFGLLTLSLAVIYEKNN